MRNNIFKAIAKADQHLKRNVLIHNTNGYTGIDTSLKWALIIAFVASDLFRTELTKDIIKAVVEELILNTAVQPMKKIFKRRRPNGSHQSFPSAHTGTSFLGAEVLHQKYKDEQPIVTYAAFTASTGAAILRLYHNRHWLSDVICGALLGIASARLSQKLVSKVLS